MSYNIRNGNVPLEYKASQSIEFIAGFENALGDEFTAYITSEGSNGSGNGVDGTEGLYRYGFNGREMDSEVKGQGNSLDFGDRSIYDPRLGRFVSVDPNYRNLPDYSPYQYARNSPIMLKENGRDGIIPKWLWKSGVVNPMAAGFIDAIAEDIEGIESVGKVLAAFSPGNYYFYTPSASKVRSETWQTTKTVFQVMNNPVLQGIVVATMAEDGMKTVRNADASDYQYATGYAGWKVLSFFVGVGEVSALAKTGKIGTGLSKFLGILLKSEGKVDHLANIVRRSATHINKTEWHHVISNNLINNSVVQAAIQDGYKFGERLENLIPLEKFLTKNGNGTHGFAPKYDAQLQKAIGQFEDLNPRYSNKQAKTFLDDIKDQIIKRIDENPNEKINDLDLKLEVKKY
ncbi:MAG TPA: RHS repeat-associated core domain-containing protein [Chitinophagaceae bacterium]|nr:RHS repeat-associated core domain-containing protein [Chitinophagaceae bacterium]